MRSMLLCGTRSSDRNQELRNADEDPRVCRRNPACMFEADVRRVLIGLLLLVACKDHADPARTTGQSCERVYGICPNATPASSEDAQRCADEFQGRCGAELRQYVQCASGKCDDAGAIDRVGIEGACFATIDAYRKCEESDGGVRGTGGTDEGQLPPFPTGVSDAGANDG